MSTVSEVINMFVRSGGEARTPTLRVVHLSRFYTYAFRIDATPPPDGALPDDVAWTHDPTAGRNQHPEHCGKHGGDPLEYRRRIGHTSERAATEWSSVYTSDAGLLYSHGLLIAARQSIGGRDGDPAIMIRSITGMDNVQRRHVAQLRSEIVRIRGARRPWGNIHAIIASTDVLEDFAQGPRWACEIQRQDGKHESATVHAFNRDAAWDELRKVCIDRMSDDVARSPQSVSLRPTSAVVAALSRFVPKVVTG